MWTSATRVQHTRVSNRYQTDLTDAQWLLIADMLPAAAGLGRRREWAVREIANAIFYVCVEVRPHTEAGHRIASDPIKISARRTCKRGSSTYDSECCWGRRPVWMGRAYSQDLRDRLILAVEREGLSGHAAGRRFAVSDVA